MYQPTYTQVRKRGAMPREPYTLFALKKKLADQNVEARWTTPEDLGNLLASEIRRWSDVIARAKIPRQ